MNDGLLSLSFTFVFGSQILVLFSQGSDRSSSCERVVDCLLSFLLYSESKQEKDRNVQIHDEFSHALGNQRHSRIENTTHVASSSQKVPQPRKRWAIPESDIIDDAYKTTMVTPPKPYERDSYVADENFVPISGQPGTGHIHFSLQHSYDVQCSMHVTVHFY